MTKHGLHVSWHDVGHVIGVVNKEVKNDISSTAKFTAKNVGSAGKYVIDAQKHVYDKTLDTAGGAVKNVSSSLSMPLVIVGGAVLIFMLTKK